MNNSKKTLRLVLSFLILLIPTYLTIYNIYNMSDDLSSENVTQVVVTGANGTEMVYEKPADFRPFIKAVNDARILEVAPSNLAYDRSAGLTVFKVGERMSEYDLFLDLNPDLCVVRDSEGTLFYIQPEDASVLLSTPVSDTLFEYNRVPIAGSPQGSENIAVYPAEGGVWKLLKPDGEFHDTKIESITTETNEIKISQNRPFTIYFDPEPDIVMAEVFDDKERLYTGLLSQFNLLDYDSTKELSFILTAEWRESEDKNYYGEAVYNITAIYEIPVNFSISDHQAESGGLIAVTAFNAVERERLSLYCPDIEYMADFVQDGANKIALVPVNHEFTGVLSIEIEGDYTEHFEVTVEPKTAGSKNVGAADENLTVHLSANAKSERENIYNGIFAETSNAQKLWNDNFISPSPSGENITIDFGAGVTINMGNGYTNRGINLEIDTGSAVLAGNAGSVVFTGRVPFDGNLIVIDHGAGLLTWYAHLESITVQTGETVASGQQIGVAGRSGMPTSPGFGLYFAASLGNIFINPVNLFELDDIIVKTPVSAVVIPDLSDFNELPDDLSDESALPEAADELRTNNIYTVKILY